MEKKVVSAEENKILKKMFWNSHLVFANFNMTKMEANGFTMTMAPAVESIYGDDIEGKKAAYARHQSFFNTHAVAFNFIAGLCYALEKDCHDGKVPGETIDAIKASLMGPTAGMFDSIFFNCLRVIGAGIAIGLCSQGNILGTFIFILLYGISQSLLKWVLLKLGYTLGTDERCDPLCIHPRPDDGRCHDGNHRGLPPELDAEHRRDLHRGLRAV